MFILVNSTMSTSPKMVLSTLIGWFLCVGDGCGDGLVVDGLFSRGDSFCENELHHTQHISVFCAIWFLVSETLALETLLDRGCCSKFLDLENYACFLAY